MQLVDTNVVSELCRREPDAGVLAWAATQTRLALSVITVEEIAFGLSRRPNPVLRAWFEGLRERHEVLPVSPAIAQRAGAMRGAFAAGGTVRTQVDMLIAATALVHQLPLVTRNLRDFDGCGVPLLNPFAADRAG